VVKVVRVAKAAEVAREDEHCVSCLHTCQKVVPVPQWFSFASWSWFFTSFSSSF